MGGRRIKSALVTGGGGFLGKAIAERLITQGYTVSSLSRKYYTSLEKLGIKQIQGDIGHAPTVKTVCKDVDVVFHTAAKPGVWGPYEDYFKTNVIGTQNILAGCKACNVDRLIYTSSPSVVFNGNDMKGVDESVPYPEKFHAAYPQTKALAEQEVCKAVQSGLKAIILRPHLIWGPEDNHLVPRILARADKLMQVGENKLVDTIYIDNAAHAHLLAAEKLADHPELSGKIYFISQDEPMPLWDMVNAILAAGGKPPIQRKISWKTARRMGAVFEWIYNFLNVAAEPRLTRFVADELGTAHWFNVSAAKRDLGYAPLVSTQEGLQHLKCWLAVH